jgi:membrane-associated phospholipid phosphatase
MELLKFLESIRTPFLDTLVGLVTQLGEETIGIIILCAVFWCISKKVAYGIGITFFLSSLTVQGMKICFRIDRPWVADPTLNPIPSALEYATGYSFPSGHTQSAAAFFGALGAQVKQKWLMTVCFIIPFLVAFSRLYLGVHTLIDVVVSLLISFLIVLLTVKLLVRDTVDKKREFVISLIMVIYAIVVIVLAAILYLNGTIEQHYVADCLKAAGATIGFAVGMYIERVYIDFPVKSKSVVLQLVKYVLGLAGVIILQEGLKLVIGRGLVADMIRYFLMLSWVTVFYPLIIKRFFKPE